MSDSPRAELGVGKCLKIFEFTGLWFLFGWYSVNNPGIRSVEEQRRALLVKVRLAAKVC